MSYFSKQLMVLIYGAGPLPGDFFFIMLGVDE